MNGRLGSGFARDSRTEGKAMERAGRGSTVRAKAAGVSFPSTEKSKKDVISMIDSIDISLLYDGVTIGNIVTPKYVGTLYITDNFTIPLMEYPSWFHRFTMERFFGWRFKKSED